MRGLMAVVAVVSMAAAAEEGPMPAPQAEVPVVRESESRVDLLLGYSMFAAREDVLIGVSGVGLGGMIGLSALGKVEYRIGERQLLCLDGGLGVAGGEYGVAYMFYGDAMHYLLDRQGGHLRVINNANAVGIRLLQVNRQRDDDDKNDAWFGKDVPRQRYNGGEVVIMLGGLRIAPGLFRGMTDGETYGCVGYGIGF